jgi:hypothetical protein
MSGAEAGATPAGPAGLPGDAAAAAGAKADKADEVNGAGAVAAEEDRCAVTGATSGARVRGRAAGTAVAAGATVGMCRIGSGSGSEAPPASRLHAGSGSGAPAARRWTGRVGIGAEEVSDGTADGRARTSPAGAVGATSWPSVCTMGGSGRWPGTEARNGAAGATTGTGPVVRWIGGSVAQAPVAGARAGPAESGDAGAAAVDAGVGSAAAPGASA